VVFHSHKYNSNMLNGAIDKQYFLSQFKILVLLNIFFVETTLMHFVFIICFNKVQMSNICEI